MNPPPIPPRRQAYTTVETTPIEHGHGWQVKIEIRVLRREDYPDPVAPLMLAWAGLCSILDRNGVDLYETLERLPLWELPPPDITDPPCG